jgi:hypothetical protein
MRSLQLSPFVRRFRQTNLQLLQQYGPNAWKVHNYVLEADAKSMEIELETLKNRVTELNRDRKNSQVCTPQHVANLGGFAPFDSPVMHLCFLSHTVVENRQDSHGAGN